MVADDEDFFDAELLDADHEAADGAVENARYGVSRCLDYLGIPAG